MKHKSPIGLDKLHLYPYQIAVIFLKQTIQNTWWASFDDYTTYNKTNALCRPQVHALDKSNFEVESSFSSTLLCVVGFFKKEAKDSLLFSKELHYYLFSRHISLQIEKILLVCCGKKLTKKNSLLLCTSEK